MEQTILSKYVKAMRKQYNLTQVELSEKSGVGLRLVRELEHGKQTLRLDKVNQILTLYQKLKLKGFFKVQQAMLRRFSSYVKKWLKQALKSTFQCKMPFALIHVQEVLSSFMELILADLQEDSSKFKTL